MGTTQISNRSLVKSLACYIRLYSLTFLKQMEMDISYNFCGYISYYEKFRNIFFCGDRKSYHYNLHMQSITWMIFLFDVMYCGDYTDL